MEKFKGGGGQANPIVKKGKKKQAKDEVDRLKQAEKKRRRLEKALATSAAIRSELEKKKQKKIEEQQKLDKEAAAVAEAVALHVLGEDIDDSHYFMQNNSGKYNSQDYSTNVDLLVGYQNFVRYSVDDDLTCAADLYGHKWNWITAESFPVHVNDTHDQYYAEGSRWADISMGLIAAQAVSGLHIAEDSSDPQLSGHGATTVINKILDKSNIANKVDFYTEF